MQQGDMLYEFDTTCKLFGQISHEPTDDHAQTTCTDTHGAHT